MEVFKRWLFEIEDKLFDFQYGIDTRGIVANTSLRTDSKFRENATAFQSVWCRNVRTLIRVCHEKGYKPNTFIDIGCGKGKACFYAATTGKFKEIEGVEFDKTLVFQANKNKIKFTVEPEINFQHLDATQYSLGENQSLVFMFNPFDDSVMSIFLRNNLEKFRKCNHIIAYANDLCRTRLVFFGFEQLWRDPIRNISLWGIRKNLELNKYVHNEQA